MRTRRLYPALRRAPIDFGLAAGVLVAVTPWLVRSSKEIAEITGLGTGFVVTTLVAMVTSLPEPATTVAPMPPPVSQIILPDTSLQ